MVRPVSLRVEAAVVMSDTSYGIHSGLVCGFPHCKQETVPED